MVRTNETESGDVDVAALRTLAPEVLSVLVRRGADFATAEDAVQNAIVKALTRGSTTRHATPRGG